jgi:hypothetical protein
LKRRDAETLSLEKNEKDSLFVIDGELIEARAEDDGIELADEEQTLVKAKKQKPETRNQKPETRNQKFYLQYIVVPLIFLTATLFGGLRFGAADDAFLFLKPALVCLIFASLLVLLFFRAGLIKIEGWFSENFTTLKNVANAGVLLTLFTASVQVFNSLLPEQGLPFWVVAFCFFWTLWNNLFAEFEVRKLLKSLGAMFGLAFVVKYLILANLTAPAAESWWRGIWENPTKEAFTWLLDLPRFAPATGYVQFFTLVFYLAGLFLLSPVSTTSSNGGGGASSKISSDKIS